MVSELNLLGLSPNVLQELLEESVQEAEDVDQQQQEGKGKEKEQIATDVSPDIEHGRSSHSHPRVVYEVNSASGTIEPRLRVWITPPSSPSSPPRSESHSPDSTRSASPDDSALSVTPDDEEAGDAGVGDEATSEHTQDSRNRNKSLIWALQRRASSPSSSFTARDQEVSG